MQYSVRIGEQSFVVEIENLDVRPVVVTVDGERFEVWPDDYSPMSREMETIKTPRLETGSPEPRPPAVLSQQAVSTRCVTAPIPGVIVSINTKPGQTVNHGDVLCVLEAMKMKNSIRAGRDGVIETISIAVGDQVRHGQTLIEYTD